MAPFAGALKLLQLGTKLILKRDSFAIKYHINMAMAHLTPIIIVMIKRHDLHRMHYQFVFLNILKVYNPITFGFIHRNGVFGIR